MTNTQEALTMAIEALNDALTRFSTFNELQHEAIDACKEALRQQEQEPVAYCYIDRDTRFNSLTFDDDPVKAAEGSIKPLYTHPAKQLSDDEIENACGISKDSNFWLLCLGIARAIEAKIRGE